MIHTRIAGTIFLFALLFHGSSLFSYSLMINNDGDGSAVAVFKMNGGMGKVFGSSRRHHHHRPSSSFKWNGPCSAKHTMDCSYLLLKWIIMGFFIRLKLWCKIWFYFLRKLCINYKCFHHHHPSLSLVSLKNTECFIGWYPVALLSYGFIVFEGTIAFGSFIMIHIVNEAL